MVATNMVEPYPMEEENIFDQFFTFFSSLVPSENANAGRMQSNYGHVPQDSRAFRPTPSCLSPSRAPARCSQVDTNLAQDDPNLVSLSRNTNLAPRELQYGSNSDRSRRHTVHPADARDSEAHNASVRNAGAVHSSHHWSGSTSLDPEDLLHQNVQYFLRKHPRVRERHSLNRIRQGVYELDGREVNVEWHYATSPGEKGYLVVVDGPLRQPLSDYMEDTEANAQYDGKDFGWSNLHIIPQEKRISFNDQNTEYSRLEAMKVAKQQAIFREKAATYVKDGHEVPGELLTSYNKTIQVKLGMPAAFNAPTPARSPAPVPVPRKSPGPPPAREPIAGPQQPHANGGPPHAAGQLPTTAAPTVPAEVPLTTAPVMSPCPAPPHIGVAPPSTPAQVTRTTLRPVGRVIPPPSTPAAHMRELPATLARPVPRNRSPSPQVARPSSAWTGQALTKGVVAGSVSIPAGGGSSIPTWQACQLQASLPQGARSPQAGRSGSKARPTAAASVGASSPGAWAQAPASRGNSIQSNRAPVSVPTRIY